MSVEKLKMPTSSNSHTDTRKTLPESEERYRKLVDLSPQAVIVHSGQRIIYVNQKALELFGTKDETDILGHNPLEFVHPDDQSKVIERVKKVLQTGTTLPPVIERYTRKDGSVFQGEVKSTPITYMGKPASLVIINDMTERLKNEAALRESEEKYRAIIDTIEDGYYEADLNGNLMFFNPALQKMLKYSPEELIGLNNRAFMNKDTARAVYKQFNKVFKTGIPLKELKWKLIAKDGSTLHVDTSISLIRDDENNPIGFRGIARDVSKTIQANTNEKAARQLAEARASELEILARAAANLNQSIVIDENILETLETAINLIHADAAWIMALDENDSFKLVASHGFPKDLIIEEVGIMRWQTCRCQKEVASGKLMTTEYFKKCDGLSSISPKLQHIASIPLRVGGQPLGVLNLVKESRSKQELNNLQILTAIGDLLSASLERIRLFEKVQWMASTDPLTKIYNRRKFFELAEQKLAEARKNNNQIAIIMFDVDWFKKINDRWGHTAGDIALQAIIQECKMSLRDEDFIGRYGGDEFFAFLSEVTPTIAEKVAERLRSRVEKLTIQYNGNKINATISLGVALSKPGKPNIDKLVIRADTALYQSKTKQRNCVTLWHPETQPD
jgi:diguanylate cyclase (GGDEF)-like protein/PAS domain S-box-containing protein